MKCISCIYHGRSMAGTFHEGDVLTVVKTPFQYLRPGDIIVFRRFSQINDPVEIVHRVIRQSSTVYHTRGDAMAHEDAGVVTGRNLVGRISYKERNGRVTRVHGGWIGLCRGRELHCYWGIRRWMVRAVQPLYDKFKQSGIISRIWKPEITRVCMKTMDGCFIQFLYNKRVIARFWPEEDRFECKKPWDLVVRVEGGR